MPVYQFFWTDDAIEHCTAHGIDLEEFEEIVQHPQRTDKSKSTGKICAFGETYDGRYTICVYEMLDALTVHPITAYPIED